VTRSEHRSRLYLSWPWMLLPVWLMLVSLNVYSLAREGVRFPRMQVQYVGSDAYPRIIGGAVVTTDPSVLNARAFRLGSQDLRGFGFIGFRAHALALGQGRDSIPVVVLQGGRQRTLTVSFSTSWTELPRLAFHAALVLVAVLVLRRAPSDPQARQLYFASLAFAIWQSRFWTPSVPVAYAQSLVFYLFGGPALVLVLRWAILFPAELQASRRLPMGLAFAVGGLWALSRLIFLFFGSIPIHPYVLSRFADLLLPATLLFILGWNFANADPVGRRRTQWVVTGVYISLIPAVAALIPAAIGDFGYAPGVSRALQFSRCLLLAIPLGVFIAIVRHNLFDIDRIVSIGTTYSIAVVTLGGTALYLLPGATTFVKQTANVSPPVARAVSAWFAAFVIFFIARRLQPSVERMLYPDRHRLQQGVHKLLEDLRACARAGELVELVSKRVITLLQPETCILHTHVRDGFAASPLRGSASAQELEAERMRMLEATARVCREESSPGQTGRILLPMSRGTELAAVLELGPKQSGDIYTATDLTLLQAIADQASAELRRLQRSRFLADVSHDLRQPVHALGLFVEALGDAANDPARVRNLIRPLKDSQAALTHMLDDVLDWSRLDAGGLATDVRAVDLGLMFERLRSESTPRALKLGLRIRFVHTSAVVRSDPALLERILRNLVSNALRYTARGRVLVGCRRRRDRMAIQVLDTGPGISATDQTRIFEAFTRLDTSAEHGEQALGLGLAIVDGLARALEHPLTMRSVLGRGTCFELEVPYAADALPVATAPVATSLLPGKKIYVIDDDARVCLGMQELLETWGCRVQSFADLVSARRALARDERPPDALIADYRLGHGQDGVETVKSLRKQASKAIPALLVTGEVAPEVHEILRASGLRHLRKPVPPAKLRALLTHVLRESPSPPHPPA